MNYFIKIISFCVILLLMAYSSFAQVNDAGLWVSVNAEKKITHAFSASLSQEFRFNENISELGEFFTDAGVSYKLTKNVHFSADYRFTNKRKKDDMYNKRNIFYFDVDYKIKFKPIVLVFRTRAEEEFKQIRNTNDDKGPSFCSKNKLSIKLDFGKKYVPYVPYAYVETFSPFNSRYGIIVNEIKLCGGIEYHINRVHAFDLYYLIQRAFYVKNPETDYIVGIEYDLNF